MSMLYYLVTHRTTHDLVPEHFLKAGSETLAAIFIGSWALTLIFNFEFTQHNPIKSRLGYNNLCVGFDSSPARYYAMPWFVLKAYLDIRYVFAAMQRSDLEKRDGILKTSWRYNCSICANGVYAFYLLFLPFLVFVEPSDNDSVVFHYSIFAILIMFRLLLVTSNYIQRSDAADITLHSWIWYFLFVFTTFTSLILSFLDFLFYDARSQKPIIPWELLMTIDYTWFALVFLTTYFLPDSSIILVSYELVSKGAPIDNGNISNDMSRHGVGSGGVYLGSVIIDDGVENGRQYEITPLEGSNASSVFRQPGVRQADTMAGKSALDINSANPPTHHGGDKDLRKVRPADHMQNAPEK